MPTNTRLMNLLPQQTRPHSFTRARAHTNLDTKRYLAFFRPHLRHLDLVFSGLEFFRRHMVAHPLSFRLLHFFELKLEGQVLLGLQGPSLSPRAEPSRDTSNGRGAGRFSFDIAVLVPLAVWLSPLLSADFSLCFAHKEYGRYRAREKN